MKQSSLELSSWPDPADWIEENFWIPELKGPIQLEPYQRDALREALRRDEDGKLAYSTVVWSDIKKSAKSTICAAVILYFAMHTTWGEIYMIANDLKQADSRVAKYFRRALDLNPEFKRYRDWSQRGYMMTINETRTTVEAIPIDPSGEAGSNADVIQFSELWGAHEDAKQKMFCFDDQTTVLTSLGWVGWKDLTSQHFIATVNPETHFMEWQQPVSIFRDMYSGKMHLYESYTFSKCVTPNHRLYGIYTYNAKDSKYAKSGIMKSCDLRSSGYGVFFPRTTVSGYVPQTRFPWSFTIPPTKHKPENEIFWEDWCEYMGWYLSEGHTNDDKKRGPTYASISQSPIVHPEYWKEIKQLHDRMFGGRIGYSITNNDTAFVVSSAPFARTMNVFGNSYTKFVPIEIKESPEYYLRIFFDAFVKGDGHIQDHGSIQMSVKSDKLADDLLEIGIKLGYGVSRRWGKTAKVHRLLFTDGKDGYTRELSKRHGHWKTIDYEGIVWCPSVSNGLVITMRNGKVCVSGNSEMTLSPTKHGQSLRWIESYAGYTDESELLYGLYERGILNGEPVDNLKDKLYHSNLSPDQPTPLNVKKEGRMFCLWNQEPRCPWQTKEYYAEEEKVLLPSEFQRMHRNQWVTSIETFVPIEWWDDCKVDELPEIDPKTPMIVSLDAGISNDPFGMIMVHRHPTEKEAVVLKFAKRWLPPKGGKLNFQGTEERPGPELELERLMKAYNIIQVAYDPYQLEDLAGRWKRKRVTWMFAFDQGTRRLKSDSMLRDKIRGKTIIHDGSFPEVRENILNANAKISSEDLEDRKIRIVKKTKDKKVDLTVALAMAVFECMRLNV